MVTFQRDRTQLSHNYPTPPTLPSTPHPPHPHHLQTIIHYHHHHHHRHIVVSTFLDNCKTNTPFCGTHSVLYWAILHVFLFKYNTLFNAIHI